jgi:beta-lactamase regulating signal transducer with metallopeptidase domain
VEHVLNWVWQGMVVAVATALALRFLLHRARARDRYAVCWIALVTILVLPLFPLFRSAAPAGHLAALAAAPVVAVPQAWWTSATVVFLAWALWSTAFAIRLADSGLALRRLTRTFRAWPRDIEQLLRCWNAVRDRGRPARLASSHGVRSAAVIGGRPPVIAVAPALLQKLTAEELDRVVVHEWAHVQRRDDLLNVAHVAIRMLAGWHPAIWWLDRQMLIEREAACDELAVAVTGCPKRYAACLTTIAEAFPRRWQSAATIGVLSSPGLSARVVRILAHKRLVSTRSSATSAATALASIAVLGYGIAGIPVIGVAAVTPDADLIRSVATPVMAVASLESVRDGAIDARPVLGPQTRPSAVTVDTPDVAPPIGSAPAEASGDRVDESAASPAADVQEARMDATATIDSLLEGRTHPLTLASLPASGAVLPESEALPVPAWELATQAGVAVGRSSQKAAVATAGFFTRFGKRVAGSF